MDEVLLPALALYPVAPLDWESQFYYSPGEPCDNEHSVTH
jgi:hypothetical protein